ncbi:hypothetical protein Q4583_01065 [Neptunomonas phycophila]|uniref:hypothetical protein n=1 Tax=Neptunomonas phycophila TaxID=1572645 RepID=UPI0026E1406E|nr:hypothetical protein [Neptunomonas phycophila]MDO6782686.1 hypothetical protein [Neptunomonas phycophila]
MKKPKILLVEPAEYYREFGILNELESVFDIEYPSFLLSCTLYKIKSGYYCYLMTCIFHSPLSRFLTCFAREYKISSVYFMDGIGDFANFKFNKITLKLGIKQLLPPMHDLVYCVDPYTRDYVDGFGVKAKIYQNKRVFSKMPSMNNSADEVVEGSSMKALITLANTPALNDLENKLIKSLIVEISNALDRKNIDIIYRLYDEEYIPYQYNYKENRVECGIEEAISDIDLFFSSSSSVLIPFMMKNKPVCLLDYRYLPIFLQTGWRISSLDYIDTVVESMVSKDKDCMLFQKNIVETLSSNSALDLNSNSLIEKQCARDISYLGMFGFGLEYYKRYFYKLLKKGFLKKILKNMRKDK